MKLSKKGFMSVLGLLITIAIIAYVVYVYMGKSGGSAGSPVQQQQGAVASMEKAQSTIDAVNKISQERYKQVQ